ncbi:MAG: hypothetical protein COA79_22175 [Planctomycetota bacterium]|nr:MAG: hypothetical protein COA79_22175 [Planctomycetota bacterium]
MPLNHPISFGRIQLIQVFSILTFLLLLTIMGCGRKHKRSADVSQVADHANLKTQNEIMEVSTAIANPNETVNEFGKKVRAVVESKKLLGLTRAEVEKKLGSPTSSDWFVHLSKPRFGGDRLLYTVFDSGAGDFKTYASLGLFMRRGKVYSCVLWIRRAGRLTVKYQKSSGRPIRFTWN